MAPYSSEVLNTIQNISPLEWNEIIGAAIGVSHAVLTCYELGHSKALDLRYFLLRDEQRLQAIGVASVVGNDGIGIDRIVLGRLAEKSRFIRQCFRPALICGLPRGPGCPVLLLSGCDQKRWIRYVVDVMEAYAGQQGLGLGFTSVLPEQTELIRQLTRRGYYSAYGLPETKALITWKDEKTYLKTLRTKSKNDFSKARREMNRFRRSGILISEWDGRNESSLYKLLKKHHDDRNDHPFDLPPTFLSLLKGAFSDDLLVYIAQKEEILVGVCVLLKRGRDGWLWKVGIDHAADANNFTYFNLNFYHVFLEAPAHGLRQIRCGNAALYAKTRRGCEAELTHVFYKPGAAWPIPILPILFPLQKFWYRRKFLPYLPV